jgi:pimeloyl-ACP methyl ester carboxylesterase
MATPVTHYAKSGDVHIAYQVFGSGPIDLVLVPGFVSHLENYWDGPDFARWLLHLGSFARVVMFDKRGTGLSDRLGELPALDERMDDARAVMDAVGIKRAAFLGVSEGGPLAVLFAATYPERCRALVLYGAFARFSSWFPTAEGLNAFFEYIETAWGTGGSLAAFAPWLWCKRFEVEPSRRREVALDHAARTAFQILGAVLPLAPSLPSLN